MRSSFQLNSDGCTYLRSVPPRLGIDLGALGQHLEERVTSLASLQTRSTRHIMTHENYQCRRAQCGHIQLVP